MRLEDFSASKSWPSVQQAAPTVFVIDQDRSVREWFEGVAGVEWHTRFFASREEFLAQPRSLLPGCLLLDLQLPDGSLELQARLAERCELPIIFMTAQANIPMTVRAMKAGAVDVLTKPFSGDTLSSVIRSALERSRSKLAHVETIESLDVVTASMAFELRQSLCGIVTNANACLRMLAADPPKFESARETMRRTIRDSNRALDVVTRFATLFGSEGATTESVDLTKLHEKWGARLGRRGR
jgi:FixJ family two-component response regulator